jgi:hypothetical protein
MSAFPSSKWERSISRMQVVTLLAFVVTALVLFGRYSRTDPTAIPHGEGSPTPVAKNQAVAPPPQQTSPVQSSPVPHTANGRQRWFEDVLSASKEQVILAIQEPIQDADVNSTLSKAKAGEASAQYDMAIRCADGAGVPQSLSDAMEWFAKAASAGNANAQWKLGLGYMNGIGVPHDEAQAAMWFKRAANSGDTRAQSALSELYFTGRGVGADYVRAYTWANIAAEGQADNGDRLELIRSRMTPAQIEDAQRRTSIWLTYAKRKNGGPVDSQ